jgi:hypothetical protein
MIKEINKNVKKWEDIEQIIKATITPFQGMFAQEIANMLNIQYLSTNKGIYGKIARTMFLPIYNQFDFQVKSIRIEPDSRCKESMSFRAIKYTEIVNEIWLTSKFRQEITQIFVFVLFYRFEKDGQYQLMTAFPWQIPINDLLTIQDVWLDTQTKIRKGNYSDFIKAKDNMIAHVRPHARNSEDKELSPQETWESKKGFWLNNKYIEDIANKYIN